MTTYALRVGPVSALVTRRWLAMVTTLILAVIVLGFVTLCYGGESWTAPEAVLQALRGFGEDAFIVREWRLPRTLAAATFGAALGLSGALLQNLTRNPLGSPDIIGLDAGSFTGALFALNVLGGASGSVTVAAVIGGLSAALAIALLSASSGLSGLRLIVVGIAVNAILTAVNAWIVLRSDFDVALAASSWNAGSLNGIGADDIRLPLVILAVTAVGLVLIARAVQQAALGDEIASTTGVRLGTLRIAMVVGAVITTATVTGVAGPIAFVALSAPQIGRRIVGGEGTGLVPAALAGAFLLLGADLVAQWLLAPESLPVGVVTTSIGGCYLIWLLQQEVRRVRRSR